MTNMTSLLLKELYQLRPIVWLLVALTVLSFGDILVTQRIDEYRFAGWCDVFCASGTPVEYGLSVLVIVFIIAYSLFPNEHDEATIEFLHSLPVSRSRLFLAKFATGFLVVLSLIVTDYALSAWLLSANPQSIDGKFYPQIFAWQIFLEAQFAFILLAHGIALSWFRLMGLIIYSVYLIALMLLETRFNGVGVLSIFSVLQVEIVGQTLQLAWFNIAVHTALAVVLLYLAYRLWSQDFRLVDTLPARSRRRWLTVLASVLVFVLAAATMGYRSTESVDSARQDKLITRGTKHYRFVAESTDKARMQLLSRNADTDYERLQDILGMQTRPTIQTDLTAVNEHALGLASWKKIRMNIGGFQSDREYRRILVHETTHAFQSIMSDRKLIPHFNATKFFIEGMAQYTSFDIVANEALRSSNWELAAIAWDRQGIDFDDVIDFNSFAGKFDELLVYTLGDIWAAAMVDACSPAILGDFLRATDRANAPRNITARAFWQRTLQHSNCELDTVIDAWHNRLEQTLAETAVDAFPRHGEPRFEMSDQNGQLRISVELLNITQGELPETFLIKLRNDGELSDIPDSVFSGGVVASGPSGSDSTVTLEFLFPAKNARQGRIRYQLGYVPRTGQRAYFERWRRASL